MHFDVRAKDVDLKRLGSVLWLAQETQVSDFEDLLLLKGMGPRTLQSLALVSEVINGTPTRFSDPARFSFAHGGKSGRPFAVPITVYDETIATLTDAVEKAKIGQSDKLQGLKKLSQIAQASEENFQVTENPEHEFAKVIAKERADSWRYGGKTIHGESKPLDGSQLELF
jgi:hypothetical protein